MKPIIVAIDFSENSRDALQYAFQYGASIGNVPVVLYHSMEPNTFEEVGNFVQQLKEWGSEGSGNLKLYFETNKYSLEDGIELLIEKYDAGLVIMGITGKNKIGQKLIGSQVFKTVENAMIPVMIIPAGVIYEPIKHVALAIPFIPELKERVPHVEILKWIRALKAGLTIINVGQKKEDKQDIYQGLAALFEMFDEDEAEYHFPSGSNVAGLILDYVKKNEVQMIASISGSYGFLERLFKPSVTKKVAYGSKVPMIVFPQHEI